MKLKDVMPTLLVDGAIFKYLTLLTSETDFTAYQFGVKYWGRSGNKTVNSLVEEFTVNGELSNAGIETIGNMILGYYGNEWTRIIDALKAEYSPIENYDRNELTTNANSGSDTDSYGSMTRTLGEQTHTMSAKTDTNDHSVTSYNSSSLTPDSRDTMTEGQHTVTDGQRQDTDSQHSDTHTKGTTLTTTSRVHGNVGVTTNQQMIESELKLRKTSMIEIFLRDIDDFLCLKVYE